MTRIATQYGYDVLVDGDEQTLPGLITPADISQAAGGRIAATDPRLPAVCAAVSAAIRDFCGWHIAPSLQCEFDTQVDTRIVVLPAKLVHSIDRIETEGEEVSDFRFKRSGLVQFSAHPQNRGEWGAYQISYHAGIDDISSTPILQVACQVALNNLVATPGVRGESVGQVSMSYNLLSDGVSGGVQLLARDKEQLKPYRIYPRA